MLGLQKLDGGLEGGGLPEFQQGASIFLAVLLCALFVLVLFCASGHVYRSEERERWAAPRTVFSCEQSGCVVALPAVFDPLEFTTSRIVPTPPIASITAAALFPTAAPVSFTPPTYDAPPPHVRIPNIGRGYTAFNTSVARVRLAARSAHVVIGVTRVSYNRVCPVWSGGAGSGAHMDDASTTRIVNHVMISIQNVPFRVTYADAMRDELWPRRGPRVSGIEDARPFEIQPGLLGLAATYSSSKLPQMCLVVLKLPTPEALKIMETAALTVAPAQPQDDHKQQEQQEQHTLSVRAIVLLGPNDGAIQKNWMPFVKDENLWLVKHVAPQTNVLLPLTILEHARGVVSHDAVTIMHADQKAVSIAGTRKKNEGEWRGSTPLVPWATHDLMICIVHRLCRKTPPLYEHAFASFSNSWPHRLVAVSRAFQFDVAHTTFSFVAGLLLPDSRVGSDALITFGADDCYALFATVELNAINTLFQQGPDVSTLHVSMALDASGTAVENTSSGAGVSHMHITHALTSMK